MTELTGGNSELLYPMRFTVCCNPSWEKEKNREENQGILAWKLEYIAHDPGDPITQKYQQQISSPCFLSDSLAFGFVMETKQGGFGMKKMS